MCPRQTQAELPAAPGLRARKQGGGPGHRHLLPQLRLCVVPASPAPPSLPRAGVLCRARESRWSPQGPREPRLGAASGARNGCPRGLVRACVSAGRAVRTLRVLARRPRAAALVVPGSLRQPGPAGRGQAAGRGLGTGEQGAALAPYPPTVSGCQNGPIGLLGRVVRVAGDAWGRAQLVRHPGRRQPRRGSRGAGGWGGHGAASQPAPAAAATRYNYSEVSVSGCLLRVAHMFLS